MSITSLRNPRIVDLRKLDQRKHRQEQGRFAVEGLQLLHMALDSVAQPLDLFYCEELFTGDEAPALLRRFRAAGATLQPVSPDVMRGISDREAPQGLVATFPLPQTRVDSLNITGSELVIVLDRLNDPGNVGTIIRTADAVGARAVILITPAVDPFDPKTVRSTMGSLFNVPVILTSDVPGLFAWLSGQGLRPLGADARRGVIWTESNWQGGTALVLGNEARGLSDDVSGEIETWVALPILGKAESLNVAIAGGVLMYAWVAQNSG